MNVAVIKYNAGNIRSVDYALKRLGVEAVITADKEVLQAADKVIFPGVGEAETTMKHLRASRMDELIKNLRQPVLGICLGMQLMCSRSEEGEVDCLGIFDVPVKRFVPQKHEDKVPHMGWNTIGHLKSDLFEGFTQDEFVYFVHSFANLQRRKRTIYTLSVQRCIKIIFMPRSFILKRAVRQERGF